MQNSRKTLIPVFEVAAVALVLLDVALGFASAWAAQQRDAARDLLTDTRRRVLVDRARIASLESFQAQLPDAADQIKEFQSDHVSPRREGFLRASQLVRDLADKSNVKFAGVSYKIETKQEAPYSVRLGMEIGLEGPFSNLANFSHELETADEFVVVRSLVFTTQQTGKLSLKVGADFYMKP